MTQAQSNVLWWMDKRGIGAVMFEGNYRFKQSFRDDPELAERYLQTISIYPVAR